MPKKRVKKKRVKSSKNVSYSDSWFRANVNSNFGVVPLNWKGWISLILLIGVNIFSALYFRVTDSTIDGLFSFLVVLLLSIFVFTQFSIRRTKKVK